MNVSKAVNNTGKVVHADPVAAFKTLLFILIGLLVIYLAFRFLKGLKKISDNVGELLPTTESQKLEVVGSPEYQEGIRWLGDVIGIEAIIRSKKFKDIDSYLASKKFPRSEFGKYAQAIWDAKMPFYIDQNAVYNAIAALPSKAAVSLMAGVFNEVYGKLWNGYPLNDFLTKYMKPEELNNVTKLINQKPEL